MAFNINDYSPDQINQNWQGLLQQAGGNESNALNQLMTNAQNAGAGYNDIMKYAQTVNPNLSPYQVNSYLQNTSTATPTSYATNLVNNSGIGGSQPTTNNTGLQAIFDRSFAPYQQQLANMSSQFGQMQDWFSQQQQQWQNQLNTNQGNYLSGSYDNGSNKIYPTMDYGLNNFRGARYFNQDNNQYATADQTQTASF